jgi:REP element-mobilizing transposase RayT
MPNHIHFLAQSTAEDPLADIIRDYKQHTADRIVRQLKVEHNEDDLYPQQSMPAALEPERRARALRVVKCMLLFDGCALHHSD